MKKYVRQVLDDLNRKKGKDPAPVVPTDLENQDLSNDPAERVRQLDFQAQEKELLETDS
jgi:hypothetical protein